MINSLSNEREIAELAEAKKQGHKFMKIYLHPSKIQRNQRRIIISGAVTLHSVITGLDQFGGQQYNFEEKRGDSMIFEFDSNEREYICWLYDDPGKGYFSPNGYNRDLLASHWDQDFFIIRDPDLYADIKLRRDYLTANPKVGEVEKLDKYKPVNKNLSHATSVEEIDAQLEFLLQRKEHIIQINNENAQEEILKAKIYEEKKAEKEKLEKEKKRRSKNPTINASKKLSSKKTEVIKPPESLENLEKEALQEIG